MKVRIKILIMLGIFTLLSYANSNDVLCNNMNDAIDMRTATIVYSQELTKKIQEARKIAGDAVKAYEQKKLKNPSEWNEIDALYRKVNALSDRIRKYTSETTAVNRIINKKQYQKACNAYMIISQKYNTDIKAAQKTTITMESLQKDGAKNGNTCGAEEVTFSIMLFMKTAMEKGMSNHPELKKILHSSGMNSITNPNAICEDIKKASNKMGISYSDLMEQVKKRVIEGRKKLKERNKIRVNNEKKNKNYSVNDSIELSYKKEDLVKKFLKLNDYWYNEYSNIQNSKREEYVSLQRKKISETKSKFIHSFKKDVHVYTADGQYDKACKNYKKLETKYNEIFENLSKVIDDDKKRKNIP